MRVLLLFFILYPSAALANSGPDLGGLLLLFGLPFLISVVYLFINVVLLRNIVLLYSAILLIFMFAGWKKYPEQFTSIVFFTLVMLIPTGLVLIKELSIYNKRRQSD